MRLLRAYLNEYSDDRDDRDRDSKLRLHNYSPNHFDHPDRLSAKDKWRNYGQDLKNKTYKDDIKGPKHPLPESDTGITEGITTYDGDDIEDPSASGHMESSISARMEKKYGKVDPKSLI